MFDKTYSEPAWSILRALPLPQAVELQRELEKVSPADRSEIINHELTRLNFNIMLALSTFANKK